MRRPRRHVPQDGASILTEIPSAVLARRKQQGISASELARRAEVTPAYISKIESGRARPSIAVLERLAKALNTSIAGLIEHGSVNRELARRLPLVMDIREEGIRSLLSVPDDDVKRGLIHLIDQVRGDSN